MKPRTLASIAAAAGALGLLAAAPVVLGNVLCAPAPRVIGAAPADLAAESVTIPCPDGHDVHGWFVRGTPGRGAILLLHPVRANRLAMLERARWLAHEGYAVLLVDLQGHGETPGAHITFGWLEGRCALASARWLREKLPGERVGAIGASLGGASALLAPEPLPVDALVLEAVFPSIEEAVRDRLRIRLGALGDWFVPLLTGQMKPRLGIEPEVLRPIDHLGALRCPVFVIAGARDEHTRVDESRAMFAAAREPRELWIVDGAAHVDLLRFAKDEYTRRVGGFLDRSLRGAHSSDHV